MYKETLDILSKDITEPFKKTILENQLKYHFKNKTDENKIPMDCNAFIVRRILGDFNISKIIGVQPITNKDPVVISEGVEYEITPNTRKLQARSPVLDDIELNSLYALDLEAEMNIAIAAEVEGELTKNLMKIISDNIISATTIKSVAPFLNDHGMSVTDLIIKQAKEVDANWIIVSPMVISLLQINCNIKTNEERSGGHDNLMLMGWIDDDISVYSTLWADDEVLIGSKDPDSEDAPVIYAPETMLMVSGKKRAKNEFSEHFDLYTKEAMFVNTSAVFKKYRKIIVNFEE